MREPVFGAILIGGLIVAAINEAMDAIIAHPNLTGAVIAFSIAYTTTFICRSIYRDRIG